MKGDALDDDCHILRYAKPTNIDTVGGQRRIMGSAFWSRPIDDNGASYNWLECFEGSEEQQISEIRRRARLRPAATALLAKLNVGQVMKALNAEFAAQGIEILQDPLDATEDHPLADPSHALMIKMPAEGEPLVEAIGDILADLILETVPAKIAPA